MKTYTQKTSEVTHEWHLVDAKGKVLGRLATEIAQKLIGKHKATYTPHIDAGDFVVVINAQDIVLTRQKANQKEYHSHSGFPGNIKMVSFSKMLENRPEEVIAHAVKNMLPKNRLRSERMARLKVYAGPEHKHTSQLPSKSVVSQAATTQSTETTEQTA